MNLLFITQKIHEGDDDLAFTILWIEEFIRQGFAVQVVCLERGEFNGSFPVYSLGKETGTGKIRRVLRFLYYITHLRYDRVFVHMNPEYVTLGSWWWVLRRIPVYVWYTHYTMHIHLRIAGWIARRLFAATAQSLPQFEGNEKKVVTGHGIDMNFWGSVAGQDHRTEVDEYALLAVHRLSRSKRLERTIRALSLLPKQYTLTVYGREIDPVYASEIRELIQELGLGDRIAMRGPVPMGDLRHIYPRFRLMINMATETIDKTMLEAMLFGIYPVVTPANARAIGLPVHLQNDAPETIASFITDGGWRELDPQALHDIVAKRHSLPALITTMRSYIQEGI